ncbi:MAG: glycosyltransferase family 4 protein [Gammaproteobacteria bacterium]|nr:glycosyltransferase family 4 protein [Gammaproteobacteria bacterium]MCP5426061.1 glycosyltransferase family 4 protein [Gammaproteobacteria bacterium]
MPAAYFLLPGDPETKTGGYLYAKRIIAGLRSLGWMVNLQRLGSGFPRPDERELNEARVLLAAIPSGSLIIVDGLALGGMPELVEAASSRLYCVALIHHPLALETGLSPAEQTRLATQEKAALATVQRVIVTSLTTAQMLQSDYGVAPSRSSVVTPGTDPAPLARGSGSTQRQLLCVASFTPRKAHAHLLDALAGLRDRAWRLRCIGNMTLDPATTDAVRRQIARLDLADRVELIGQLAPERLAAHYDQADAFVLPSYLEGYGMALAEALARGLPIVSTTGGAIPTTVPDTAGLLAPPGDVASLRDALACILDDTDRYHSLAQGARAARLALPTWKQATERFAHELAETAHWS